MNVGCRLRFGRRGSEQFLHPPPHHSVPPAWKSEDSQALRAGRALVALYRSKSGLTLAPLVPHAWQTNPGRSRLHAVALTLLVIGNKSLLSRLGLHSRTSLLTIIGVQIQRRKIRNTTSIAIIGRPRAK